MYTCVPSSWTSCSSPRTPTSPPGSPQTMELSSLHCRAASHQLSSLHPSVQTSIPASQVTPRPRPTVSTRLFSLYLCIPALTVRSSVPFFWIPRIWVNMQYLLFSFLLHSLWQSLGPSVSLTSDKAELSAVSG